MIKTDSYDFLLGFYLIFFGRNVVPHVWVVLGIYRNLKNQPRLVIDQVSDLEQKMRVSIQG